MPPSSIVTFGKVRGVWVVILAFTYAAFYLLHHIGTPLGQVAVLDGREIIAWANAFARGDWPGEPFFRAPLYPLLLAAVRQSGVPETSLMLAAQLVNLFAHALSAWLIFHIACEVWRQQAAALISGMLFAIYPLAVFYVGEPLDISIGTSLFLAGLLCALRGGRESRLLFTGCAGLLLAVAVAARPHFLSAAIALAAIPVLLCSQPRSKWSQIAAMTAGLLIGLSSLGALNAWQSGQFQILPSQGGYNLWAANRPGSNGLFYEQRSNFLSQDPRANTARLESERLYQIETGNSAVGHDYGMIADYWRQRTLTEIRKQPLRWVLLELRKFAALIHNTEQYNNKTFAFHKEGNVVLRLNPLGWGVLSAVAFVGLAVGWRRRELQALFLIGACYAVGVLIFYASARFRFPLAALLCVAAGGLVPLWQQRRTIRPDQARPWVLVLTGLAFFSFFPFQWSRAEKTFDEDRLLLARAQAQLGQYRDSIAQIEDVLSRKASLPRAWDLLCATHFNSLRGQAQNEMTAMLPQAIDACLMVADVSAQADWILAFEWWLAGRRQRAIDRWQFIAASKGPEWQRALACLLLTGRSDAGIELELENLPIEQLNDLLLLARSSQGNIDARQELRRRYADQAVELQLRWLRQVFASEDHRTQ